MSPSTVFQIRPVGAAIVGTVIAAVANYAICRVWVFGKHKPMPNPVVLQLPAPPILESQVSESKVAA